MVVVDEINIINIGQCFLFSIGVAYLNAPSRHSYYNIDFIKVDDVCAYDVAYGLVE